MDPFERYLDGENSMIWEISIRDERGDLEHDTQVFLQYMLGDGTKFCHKNRGS